MNVCARRGASEWVRYYSFASGSPVMSSGSTSRQRRTTTSPRTHTHQHTIQPRHKSNHTTTTTATYHFAPFCRRQLVRPTLHTLDGSQLEGAPRCTSRPPSRSPGWAVWPYYARILHKTHRPQGTDTRRPHPHLRHAYVRRIRTPQRDIGERKPRCRSMNRRATERPSDSLGEPSV